MNINEKMLNKKIKLVCLEKIGTGDQGTRALLGHG